MTHLDFYCQKIFNHTNNQRSKSSQEQCQTLTTSFLQQINIYIYIYILIKRFNQKALTLAVNGGKETRNEVHINTNNYTCFLFKKKTENEQIF